MNKFLGGRKVKVLVTGGAGYIGSTICSALTENGHIPIILDSLVNGRREFTKDHIFYEGDIGDGELLGKIWKEQGKISSVIHLAAFISVPESVSNPYKYYENNIEKGIRFFHHLTKLGCKNVIFSSSASVYGNSKEMAVTETHPVAPESPYAKTKAMMEEVLKDFSVAYGMNVIALRYFNPIGVDPKFRTGSYIEKPSHILGVLLTALDSKSKQMTVTGVDYATRDGSGIRDYIHIWDLARAHVNAVEKIEDMDVIKGSERINFSGSEKNNFSGRFEIINIGRGDGVTVKEFVDAFEKAAGQKLDVKEGPPRDGDVIGAYAVCDKAKTYLNWEAKLTIEQGIRDALEWVQGGYLQKLSKK